MYENLSMAFLSWSENNQTAQPQRLATGLQFQVQKLQVLFEQQHQPCAADQHLCFGHIDSTIPLLSKSKI